MDSINDETINANQGNELPSDIQALSDMADKMEQQSNGDTSQIQADNPLVAKIKQAGKEEIGQEHNERFSQLGNSTLRIIAEQSVMSDTDREDARKELKRREGERYKEPDIKTTISREDFEAFKNDMKENLYGVEKNSDGKYEVWAPTKKQREYLEAKKAGRKNAEYPNREIKQTMTEYEADKRDPDNIVDEYLQETLDNYRRIGGYSKDEKRTALKIYNDRRDGISRNPYFYRSHAQNVFTEALRNGRPEDITPKYLETVTKGYVRDIMRSRSISGYNKWQREKDLVRNALISSDKTDFVIDYDIKKTLEKNKDLFIIPKNTEDKIVKTELWEGRLCPQTLMDKPEVLKKFLLEHNIDPDDKDNKIIAIKSVQKIKESLPDESTEEQLKEYDKKIKNLDQIFGLSDYVYNEVNRIMTKSKNGQFILRDDGLHSRSDWTPPLRGNRGGWYTYNVPIELCGKLVSDCEQIEQKVYQKVNEMMQADSIKESNVRDILSDNPSENYEAFYIRNNKYGTGVRKAWQKKLQTLNLVYNSATTVVKFEDIEHKLQESPLTDEEKKFYWNIGRGRIRDIEFSKITLEKKNFETELSEAIKDIIATGTVDYYEYNGYGSQKQSDCLVEQMLKTNPDILDDWDLSSMEMYRIGIDGWLNTLQSVNGDKSKQANWYFENIIKYHGDNFISEDYPKIREDLTWLGATGTLRKINAFLKNNNRFQKWLKSSREREETTEEGDMIDISEAFHLELSNKVRMRIKSAYIEEIEGYSEASVFNSGPEREPQKYRETIVPANYGDYKIEAILNLFEYFKNTYPESNARLKIHRFGEPKEQEEIQSNILEGKYPSESYFGFTFTYNGEPCGIFDNIGNDPGSGRVVVHGEEGDDACELLFKDSRMDALYRGQVDNKTIRFNHKDPEHIDESLRRLDLRTLYWLKNGKRLDSKNGYDTNTDVDNRDSFYDARTAISTIESRLESDEDLDQETINELNKTLENARKILDKAHDKKQKGYENTFI